jgi:regulator of replication initiation timing
MNEDQLIKKNKDLDAENKRLKKQLLFEQQERFKLEKKLKSHKRELGQLQREHKNLTQENRRLTLETSYLNRQRL